MANDIRFPTSLLWMTPFIPNHTGILIGSMQPFPPTISQLPPPVTTGGGNYEHKSEISEQPESETLTVVIEPEIIEPEVYEIDDNISKIIEDIPEAEEIVETIELEHPSDEIDSEVRPIEVDDAQKKDTSHIITKLVSTDYQCAPDDFYIGINSNNSINVTLPLNPKDGAMLIIKSETKSLTNNKKITIVTADDSVIDGNKSYFIRKQYGVARLVYHGSDWYSV